MRSTIETAPRDGNVIIIEDDAKCTYAIAHWSPEAGQWVDEDDKPTRITPSHWYPMQGENNFRQEDDLSNGPAEACRTVQRRRFTTSSIAATLVAAALVGVYFRAEIAASLTRYADLQAISSVGTTGGQLADQATEWLSQVAVQAYLMALQQYREAEQGSVSEVSAPVRTALQTPSPDARQSSENEQQVFAKELAEVRHAVDGLRMQAATARQSLGQEREKTTALMQDAAAAQQELAASTAQDRQTLEAERARSVALAGELATAQRDLDTKIALLSKADDAAAKLKLAMEATTAELRQSLKQESDRVMALASELATTRRDFETKVALATKEADEAARLRRAAESKAAELQQSLLEQRQRSAALASELAAARSDLDVLAEKSNKTGDEAAQVRQADESKTAELRQSLLEERQKSATLASELAAARSDLDAMAAQSNKRGDEAAQLRQAAESKTAELGQSLLEERQRSAALASELAAARSDLDAMAAQSNKRGDEAAQLRQAAEAETAELRRSLQEERQRTAALARDLESAQRVIEARMTPERTASGEVGQVKEVAEPAPAGQPAAVEQPAAREARSNPEATRMMALAGTLLAQGNIGAARIVLERAAETGSAEASFALAETYDPLILSSWGTYGTRGDATKAREFYTKADAGGIQEARNRFNALRQ